MDWMLSNDAEYVGKSVGSLLQRFGNNTLQEEVDFCTYCDAHLRLVIGNGDELNPEVEGNGRTFTGEFDALGLFTLYDTQSEFAYRRGKKDTVLVKLHIVQLLLGFFQLVCWYLGGNLFHDNWIGEHLLQTLKIAQIRETTIEDINVLLNYFDFAFIFA
ncbi:hypothetical protein EVA_05260 [gut metagenome]|uniref:Uncharacterized protein n=1 Tax=gut metagenome TaxID=749906 RepID=J9GGT1_9ZZZZ